MKDRIKELRRVKASELRPNPRNWRNHPPEQQAALRGILAEVGFADALLVRELKDGSLEIVDGHLRAETTPQEIVPVLVLDVTADEAAKILATHDAITGLARPDFAQLKTLLDECEFSQPTISAMFDRLQEQLRSGGVPPPQSAKRQRSAPTLSASYQLIATCDNEQDQRKLYERLTEEGYKCRVLLL